MSTNNTDTNDSVFEDGQVPKLPGLGGVGYVSGVGEGKITQSENYIGIPIQVNGLDQMRNTTVTLYYRPEWLVAGFKPGENFMYSQNIAGRGQVSKLVGLSGDGHSDSRRSRPRFNKLAKALQSLPIGPDVDGEKQEGPTISDVEKTLRNFFADNKDENGDPVKFVYTLRQQKTKIKNDDGTYQKDENGKTIEILENRYELEQFGEFTEKTLKATAKRAAKAEGNFRYTYANQLPF